MYKKAISLVLAGSISISSIMVGCNSQEQSNQSSSDEVKQEEAKDYNQVIVDNEYIKITITDKYFKAYDEDFEIGSIGYKITIENKCDTDLLIGTDHVTEDNLDLDADNMMAYSLKANTMEYSNLELFITPENKEHFKSIDDLNNLTIDFFIADDNTLNRFTEFSVNVKNDTVVEVNE